ncbi:30S ribosomal protein S15 [archaeon]|nr:30S ribosomal protein S15 [archaeon]
MARMHARRKGKSGSRKPLVKEKPAWVTMSEKEITETVVRLAKAGNSQAVIGTILRDQYAVPDVKLVTGKSVTKILEENNIKSDIPTDLRDLIKKAVNLSEHTASNPKDLSNKRGMHLIEAKIRRLVRYYKKTNVLPDDWNYSLENARLLLSR